MLDNNWVFFQLPNKKAISKSEANYWVENLRKILKIGLEFEFNLPNAKGFCKGISKSCPCTRFNENYDCWQRCLNEPECRSELKDKFDELCNKQFCSSFKMACYDCKEFTVDCLNCEHRYDPKSDPNGIRDHLREVFSPTRSYGNINSYGIHSVVTDGSLLGGEGKDKGAEVITVGRRVDYWEFFNMVSKIIQESKARGAYVNERCSTHAHVLASYYDMREGSLGRGNSMMSELERPLPQIILANFHQLCRKYQNAITWMSMGLSTREHLTRWEKYRVSVLDITPASDSMRSVVNYISNIAGKNGKYAWVNYSFLNFNENEDLTKFHVEMRVMDGLMSESAVTALSCLFFALVIKAVEISKYGLLEVGSKKWYDRAKVIKKHLMNNNSDWDAEHRSSNTGDLSIEEMEILREESYDLLNHVKHILFRLGPAYDVLEKLAFKPCALRLVENCSWEEIEEQLAVFRPQETILEHKIYEFIDLRKVIKCSTEDEWLNNSLKLLKEEIDVTFEELAQMVNLLKNEGFCIWSSQLGTLLKV